MRGADQAIGGRTGLFFLLALHLTLLPDERDLDGGSIRTSISAVSALQSFSF